MHYQWQNKHIINGIMYYLFLITFTVLQITTMKTQMHYQWQYKHIINGIMYYLFITVLPVLQITTNVMQIMQGVHKHKFVHHQWVTCTCFWLQREVTLMSQNIISMSDNTVTIADPESKNDRQFTFDSCHWSYDGFVVNEDGVAVPSGQESRFSGQVNWKKLVVKENRNSYKSKFLPLSAIIITII